MYMVKFFKTKEEMNAWRKEKGYGMKCANVPRSRTKHDYQIGRLIMQDSNWKPDEWYEEHPYCVQWNE